MNNPIKIMIFTEGTILMLKTGKNKTRSQIVKLVKQNKVQGILKDFKSYIPIKNAVEKLNNWSKQDIELFYLTSRTTQKEIQDIKNVLTKYKFPNGKLLYRKKGQQYKDVAEKIIPNILIEDDCECIGGIDEMTITHINPKIKNKIKSIPIKEYSGIDYLPTKIDNLLNYKR